MICLPELQNQCRSVGRQLEDNVLDRVVVGDDGTATCEKLNEADLDKMFEPLTGYVHGEVEKAAEQAHDEAEGANTEFAEEQAREAIADARRADLSEICLVTINGVSRRVANWQMTKRLSDVMEPPECDLKDHSNQELLDTETDDEDWNLFFPTVEVKGPAYLQELAFCYAHEFCRYCLKRSLTASKAHQIASELYSKMVITNHCHDIIMTLMELRSDPCAACGFASRPNKKRRMC